MKPSLILGALAFSLSLACSSSDGEHGSSSSSAGASSGSGSPVDSGAGPNLGIGGGLVLDNMAGTTGRAGGPLVENGECAQQSFVLSGKPADVLLVLDRSKSMIEHTVPPMDLTRWEAVKPSLTKVITATDSSVAWGLKLFPEGEGKACAEAGVTDAIHAPIAPNNAATVSGIINSTMALGNGTPTGDAIDRAAAYLKSRNATSQYIVLATDGDPSCPDSGSEERAVTALAAAKAAGFPTYVIGVLDPVEDKGKFKVLNSMAEAGGTARTDAAGGEKFYQAYSEAELTAALEAVTGQVASCVFEFDAPPPDASNVAVQVNGAVIAQDASKAQGWDYTSDQHQGLELHGEACQEVKGATANKVDIIFGCKGVPIKVF